MALWKLPFEWMREYPQTWYYMPRNRWLRGKLQALCGKFIGHEGSKTEWGYGGGDFVDNNCRWCDFVVKVPKNQHDGGKEFNYLMRNFGKLPAGLE